MRKPHHTAVGSKEIGVLIVMDYEKELFAQCTPYLQWKLEAQDYAKVGNRMDFLPRKLELMVLGKHIYLLPQSFQLLKQYPYPLEHRFRNLQT